MIWTRSVLLIHIALSLVLATAASAGPKRILVLPLDGNAEGATRSKLNATVQKLAKGAEHGAVVTVGDATFDETAAAVGCDPAAPKCAVSVRTTLGVDELVYGTVTTDPSGQTTVVVRRSSVTSNPPRESTATLAAGDPPENAERSLAPMFGATATEPITPKEPEPKALPPGPPVDHTRRNLGIGCVTGGAVLFVIGLALWATESNAQAEIDDAPTQTAGDFRRLQELEDKAQTYALIGDAMVLGGLVLGGLGGWVLYKDHKERRVVVKPAATPTGPAVMIGGTW